VPVTPRNIDARLFPYVLYFWAVSWVRSPSEALVSQLHRTRCRMSIHSSLPQRHLGSLAVSTARDLTFGASLGLDVDT
jgi:hypothetical protein